MEDDGLLNKKSFLKAFADHSTAFKAKGIAHGKWATAPESEGRASLDIEYVVW
jgi:hypothetical protein